jgi:hypothetical protein
MTRHPTSAWIVQQLREAFSYEPATSFSSSTMTPSMASKAHCDSLDGHQACAGDYWLSLADITRGTYIHALPAEKRFRKWRIC